MTRAPRGLRDERGSVSAEFAVALPAIVVVVLIAVGTLGAGARQVRLQDAAADAARLVARGESADVATAVVARAGGDLQLARAAELVCATATAPPPLSLPLPAQTATSCALAGGW